MADPRALVIGGTGPTGPFVVEGLHERGFEVTILHGGQHEYEFAVPGVRHIHEDPHFQESLERGLGGETFDLVVAQYGRLRVIAEVLRGRTERLVAVGGATGIFAPDDDPRWGADGQAGALPRHLDRLRRGCRAGRRAQARPADGRGDEHAVRAPRRRRLRATYVGYPVNYGPRTPGPVRLVGDQARARRAPAIVIADGGLKIDSRVFTANAAAAVLLVVDNPEIAAGKRYSVADENAVHDAPADRVHRPPSRPRARARRHALRARVAVPPALAPCAAATG